MIRQSENGFLAFKCAMFYELLITKTDASSDSMIVMLLEI